MNQIKIARKHHHWKEKQQTHKPAVLPLQSCVLRVGRHLAAQGTGRQAASTPGQERSGPLPASRLCLGNLTELGHPSSTHSSRSGSTAESGRTGWILGVGMPVGSPRCLRRWGRGEGSSPERMRHVPLPSTTTAVSRPFFLVLSRSCVWHCWSRKLGRPLGQGRFSQTVCSTLAPRQCVPPGPGLEGREGLSLTRRAAETAGELTGGFSFQEGEGHAGFPKQHPLSSSTSSLSNPSPTMTTC